MEKALVQDIKRKERKEDPLENFKHDKTTECSKSIHLSLAIQTQ
jgi:hypothetical protein